ncbi:MAG: transketolase family protein [Candidatus Anammoxibacter sp.]
MATRAAYGASLLALGETNKDIIVLDADLSKSTTTRKFADKFPERFFNMGIAEANMMGTAAGLASCGKIVFVSTFAIFATGRAWEQIRNTICYCSLNVKIAATHAGLGVGPDGASHQMNEDIAIMSSIPNMTVIEPCDGPETKKAVAEIAKWNGPVYMRLGRSPVTVISDEDHDFEIGKAISFRKGSDVSIIACGALVETAIEAADILSSEGIEASVINMHTIKPLDKEAVLNAAKSTGAIVTAEQHLLDGGLGSTVASFLARECPVRVEMIGIDNRFGQSGDPKLLFKEYNLTTECVVKAAKKAVKEKR